MGHLDSILGLGRSPGKGKGYPLQHFGLENSMDYIVHGVAKSSSLFDFLSSNKIEKDNYFTILWNLVVFGHHCAPTTLNTVLHTVGVQ